jgi:hypothetical protein
MRLVAFILSALGVAALLVAGVASWREFRGSRALASQAQATTEERARLRDELHKTGLDWRGFSQSLSAMPDSVRLARAGEIDRMNREYQKKVRLLEGQERELSHKIDKQEEASGDRAAKARWWLSTAGLGGGVFLVVGLVLLMRSRGAFGA